MDGGWPPEPAFDALALGTAAGDPPVASRQASSAAAPVLEQPDTDAERSSASQAEAILPEQAHTATADGMLSDLLDSAPSPRESLPRRHVKALSSAAKRALLREREAWPRARALLREREEEAGRTKEEESHKKEDECRTKEEEGPKKEVSSQENRKFLTPTAKKNAQRRKTPPSGELSQEVGAFDAMEDVDRQGGSASSSVTPTREEAEDRKDRSTGGCEEDLRSRLALLVWPTGACTGELAGLSLPQTSHLRGVLCRSDSSHGSSGAEASDSDD